MITFLLTEAIDRNHRLALNYHEKKNPVNNCHHKNNLSFPSSCMLRTELLPPSISSRWGF